MKEKTFLIVFDTQDLRRGASELKYTYLFDTDEDAALEHFHEQHPTIPVVAVREIKPGKSLYL